MERVVVEKKLDQDNVVVHVKNLNFTYPNNNEIVLKNANPAQHSLQPDLPTALIDLNLTIVAGQRCLVVGGNGAGKSTLLRVLAGKHLLRYENDESFAKIFKKDVFRDTTLNFTRAYVSADWGKRAAAFEHSVALSADIAVSEMMVKLQETFPERRNHLIKVLRINLEWRMHKCSDGQRRRVQLFLALIRPSKLIILDEVLGLLDILARQDLLAFLKEESELRQATIMLATNVFDGLSEWASDILYMKGGQLARNERLEACDTFLNHRNNNNSQEPLMRTVETWLRAELAEEQEKEGGDLYVLDAQNSAGGFANGRLGTMETEE